MFFKRRIVIVLCSVTGAMLSSHATVKQLEVHLLLLKYRLNQLQEALQFPIEKPEAVEAPSVSKETPKISEKPKASTSTVPPTKTLFSSKFPNAIGGKKIYLRPYSSDMFQEYFKQFTQQAAQGYRLYQWGIPVKHAMGLVYNHLVRCHRNMMMKKNYVHYCIFDQESGKLIGEIEIRRNMPPGDMGIWINENFWGKGVMKEAVKLAAREYFKTYPSIQEFTSAAASWNVNSIKGHLNAGFQPIGFSHDAAENLKNFIGSNKLMPYSYPPHQGAILGAISSGTLKGLPPASCFFRFTKDALAKLEASS